MWTYKQWKKNKKNHADYMNKKNIWTFIIPNTSKMSWMKEQVHSDEPIVIGELDFVNL